MSWSVAVRPDCGTTRGYDFHTRMLLEEPCQACRDAKKEHWRTRRQLNKQKLNEYERNRRIAQKQLNRDLSSRRRNWNNIIGDWSFAKVLELYGAICYLCNEEINLNAPRKVGADGWELSLHIDHVVPISKGGKDSLENVRPAHAYCNQKKGNK